MLNFFFELIHFIVFLAIISVPFIKIRKNHTKQRIIVLRLKIVYLILIPFIWLHWYYRYDHCSFTIIENFLAGKNIRDSNLLLSRILKPIFNLHKNSSNFEGMTLWGITIFLWLKILIDFIKNDYKNFKLLLKDPVYNKIINSFKILFKRKQ